MFAALRSGRPGGSISVRGYVTEPLAEANLPVQIATLDSAANFDFLLNNRILRNRKMRTFLILTLIFAASAVSTAPAFARGRSYSGGHVVHTRRAPVIMHRAVPGGGGVHVYSGR